jgi:penicillin-binding protein 2
VLAATPSFIRNPANWTAVEEGMIRVVNSRAALAHDSARVSYVIAGKTGTAERFSRTDEEWTSIGSRRSSAIRCCSSASLRPRTRASPSSSRSRPAAAAHTTPAPIARLILDAWARFVDVQREVTSR